MREGRHAALRGGASGTLHVHVHVLGVRPRLSLARLARRGALRLSQGLCCLPLGGTRLARARVEVEVEVGTRWRWSGAGAGGECGSERGDADEVWVPRARVRDEG